jgi:hypothetical protein
MSKRANLSQEGYGLPGSKLKSQLIKQYGGGISLPGKGGGISLPGKGGSLSLPGQKGGFFFALLAALIALISEAVAGITVASIGSALASGAATAVGGIVAKKIVGGASKEEVAKRVAQKVKATHKKIVDAAKNIAVKIDEVPKDLVEKAKKKLKEFSNPGEVPKELLAKIAKTFIPSVKKVVNDKIKKKMKGSGLSLPGQKGGEDINAKILAKVKKEL